jgi:hypothetical protein
VPGGAAAANTRGSGGVACRRGVKRGHHWLPWPCPLQFHKRQARSIISLLISKMQLSTMLYIIALSYRCWMKTLAALISNPCPENIPWILCSSCSSRCLALL